MSKYQEILDWLKTCPVFAERLYFASAEENDGDNVVIPFGTSARVALNDYWDTNGYYCGSITPLPSVYEEYQVQCFRYIGAEENQLNILTLDEVQYVCDWIIEQDEKRNFPRITGKRIISVEPFPFNPQAAGRDVETGLWKYIFTLRITYQNTAKGRCADE